jgi:hypothetical protein
MDLNAARERLDARHRQYLHEPIFDGSAVIFVAMLILAVILSAGWTTTG